MVAYGLRDPGLPLSAGLAGLVGVFRSKPKFAVVSEGDFGRGRSKWKVRPPVRPPGGNRFAKGSREGPPVREGSRQKPLSRAAAATAATTAATMAATVTRVTVTGVTQQATESDGCDESAGDPVEGKRWGHFYFYFYFYF